MKYKERVYNGKRTMKAKVLDFVESHGPCRFSDIQRFITEELYGPGEYDKFEIENCWVKVSADAPDAIAYTINQKNGTAFADRPRRRRVHRGVYSSAFGWNGYFKKDSGYGFLKLGEDGLYHISGNRK